MSKTKRPVRILVVDDDHDVRELLVESLDGAGYHVRAVADGEAAIAAMREHDPQLVLLDLDMPRMDGWTCVTRIQADPLLRAVPIIIASASERPPPDGVRGVLSKPFNVDAVLAVIAYVLDGRALPPASTVRWTPAKPERRLWRCGTLHNQPIVQASRRLVASSRLLSAQARRRLRRSHLLLAASR